MKLGIFDSGLGGLLIAKSIHAHMPDLDIVYLGDTLRIPYGNRSNESIYRFTERAMRYLFTEQDCALVIIACNTASAHALRRLQQGFLREEFPDRNILGVAVPTLEAAVEMGHKKLGVIATNYTIQSNIYHDELLKLSPDIEITQQATPLLVPLLENKGQKWVAPILEEYLQPIKAAGAECLILGCTHYPMLKNEIRDVMGQGTTLLSQDEIIPSKLEAYLNHHPEYADKITRNGEARFFVSDLTPSYESTATELYGSSIHIEKAEI